MGHFAEVLTLVQVLVPNYKLLTLVQIGSWQRYLDSTRTKYLVPGTRVPLLQQQRHQVPTTYLLST